MPATPTSPTDICILGAGPAGAATALRLSYLGIPCTLIDKASFPRDKICGDAISGKVTTLLNRLDPAILQRFHQQPIHSSVFGCTFFTPNGKTIRLPFQMKYIGEAGPAPGYVSRRLEFDNFLIQEVRRRNDIKLLLETEVEQIERSDEGWTLRSKNGAWSARCRLLILANGAQSRFSRSIGRLRQEPAHQAAAVRAYYRGVQGCDEEGFIELHFLRELSPGYFWIFPLPNGMCNVGLGLRSDYVKRRGVKLRQLFEELIATHPALKGRFAQAERLGEVRGYGLPLGSKDRSLSGDGYLLVGDAGFLIDPLTGEGIGNAFYSGFIAAELAEQALAENDLSAQRLRAYDVRVRRVLGSEMKISYRMQKLASKPLLLNMVGSIINGNKALMDYLSGFYTDFSLREKMVDPIFWLRMLFKRSPPRRSEQ